ncbi:LOW QUALITY PROTEIN: multidrug resistance-associated protein 1 [Lepeophtheirus salmonis]|uniref:LOW QUALITY PROTEIN: multidrug resistance-associated protein 1 n=1 Tax=Lepeophtheirus salmonis TaxID=72036 RepID=UPI001AEA5BF7|nr:LOW QUALITY PROTEIN: multidrug resistance-associated protein 1-like [Lepeophtheirus salmonis]
MGTSTFCSDPLWNSNLTWYTEDPYFTDCFISTVLVYVPSGILFLLTPYEIWTCFNLGENSSRISRTWLNFSRTMLVGFLILLSLVEFIFELLREDNVLSNIVAPGIYFLTFLNVFILQILGRIKGRVSSGPLFVFWLLEVFAAGISFRNWRNIHRVPNTDLVTLSTIVIQYPAVVILLFMGFWADGNSNYNKIGDNDLNPSSLRMASFTSKLTFSWFDPFIYKAWKKSVTDDDLYEINDEFKSCGVLPSWDREMEKEIRRKHLKNKPINILWPLVRSFKSTLLASSALQFFYSVFQFGAPQLVDLIINFVSDPKEPIWKGYLYLFAICSITFINTLIYSQSNYYSYITGLKIRTSLTSSIFNKAVNLKSSSKKQMSVGETTNLMAIDSQRLMDFCLYIDMIWSSPLKIIIAMYLLWQVLGPASLAGLAVMILLIPINIVVGKKVKKFTAIQMQNKDKRIKLMDDILNGIKVLKLYAWEPSFIDAVTNFRVQEIGALKKSALINAVTSFMWSSAPFLVALASFTTYVLIDEKNILTPSTAFVSLTLFNLLRLPLNLLPMMIMKAIQSKVSLDRINLFLNKEDLDLLAISHESQGSHAVKMCNVSLSWETDEGLNTLEDIDLDIEKGSLVAIVGQVGSGKSSLLSGILGEMEIVRGSINVDGQTIYAPQQPWLQNETLRNNILFGKRFNKKLYRRVIDACALSPDLDMLPAGDLTEIGERGINLSGGQKARVSLARCTYNNGDIYILDDPLSAVDVHVGRHLFENVISSQTGLLKNKTRIFVTHGAIFLPQTDKIIVMKNGVISESGTYRELIEKENGEFAQFLINYLVDEKENIIKNDQDLKTIIKDLESTFGGSEELDKRLEAAQSDKSTALTDLIQGTKYLDENTSDQCSSIASRKGEDDLDEVVSNDLNERLIEEEKIESGGIKLNIYLNYFKRTGLLASFFGILFYFSYQGFSLGANLWLSKWSTDRAAINSTSIRNHYLEIYAILGFFQSIFTMFGSVTIAIGTLNASMKIHGKLLENVLRAPLSFFDTNPLGRILNRFSKDIDVADTTLPFNIRMMIAQSFNVLGTIVIICIALPWFFVIILPAVICYALIQKFYISCARQVKRIESISRSPIYSHFAETLTGIPTIRAFGMVHHFIDENVNKIDFNAKCYFPTVISSRWLAVRLETLGNILVIFVALFSITSRGTTDPGMVGLSLSYALSVTTILNMLITVSTDVETNMVSVERIKEYENIPQEAPYDLPNSDPPPNWPEHGVIKFDNYKTRYRKGLDLVLKGINCTIQKGEKIGIVGRTGAGKSSLTLALFRIIEPSEGSIYIDGENIRFLGLGKLRSRITIIPQDPILFSGSLRMNLDPFEAFADRDIWIALEYSHLKSFVWNLGDGLNFSVLEGGRNLSVGQRQLICLARAILRKTQILVLDEATAAIDLETDDLIQSTIRSEFKDSTVLTIAHRINTIMDSNRIMVLDAGTIAEFDDPQNLLANPDSMFYSLVNDSNGMGNKNFRS